MKDYVLSLHTLLSYHCHRAGQDELDQFRVLRRQYYDSKKWSRYREVVKMFQTA